MHLLYLRLATNLMEESCRLTQARATIRKILRSRRIQKIPKAHLRIRRLVRRIPLVLRIIARLVSDDALVGTFSGPT